MPPFPTVKKDKDKEKEKEKSKEKPKSEEIVYKEESSDEVTQ